MNDVDYIYIYIVIYMVIYIYIYNQRTSTSPTGDIRFILSVIEGLCWLNHAMNFSQ